MEQAAELKRATYHLWTFTISKIISSFGAQVFAFAISFYILQTTGSATSFATNLICSILPRTLIAPYAGYVVDKYSRKKIVILSQMIATLAIGGLLIVSFTMGLSLIAIYTTTCILSLTSTFSSVSFTSSITSLVDEERIQKAMSLNQISISFAAIASPAVGGFLYGVVSMEVFLIIYMIASTIAVCLEATMNFKLFSNGAVEKTEEEEKESVWKSMKAGLDYLKLQPILMTMIWLALVVNFLFGAFQVGYSFILIEKMKMASEHFGLTEGSFAVGMLLMSIYFTVRKEVKFPLLVAKRGVLVMGMIMGVVSLPLLIEMSYQVMFIYYITIMFSFGVTGIVVNTPISVMMQKQIDDQYKGRVFSIFETMAMALMPLGMVLYGFLYDIFPAEWVLLVSAGLLMITVFILARPSVIRKAHPELDKRLINHPSSTSAM